MDKLRDGALKLVLIAYLAMAFFVGIEKHRAGDTIAYGTVGTILAGAAWPITLIVEAIRKP